MKSIPMQCYLFVVCSSFSIYIDFTFQRLIFIFTLITQSSLPKFSINILSISIKIALLVSQLLTGLSLLPGSITTDMVRDSGLGT